MECKRGGAGLLCLACLFLTASCGSGEAGIGRDAGAQSALRAAPEEAGLLIRYDLDEDGHLDVLRLDGDSSPLRVVEALRGLGDGKLANVTEGWAGRTLPQDLDRALRIYAVRSCAVATETELEIFRDGGAVFVSVLE